MGVGVDGTRERRGCLTCGFRKLAPRVSWGGDQISRWSVHTPPMPVSSFSIPVNTAHNMLSSLTRSYIDTVSSVSTGLNLEKS